MGDIIPTRRDFLKTALALPAAPGLLERAYAHPAPAQTLSVGAAAAELTAEDSMPIAGGIGPGKAMGQEGKLRAVATVIRDPQGSRIAIVACDILMIERRFLDAAAREASVKTGIPFDHILINCTHTHHAPSTVHIHGYDVIEPFALQVQSKIVEAIVAADKRCAQNSQSTARFIMSREATVGQNSRLQLANGMIYWTGAMDDVVGPTGPFDPDFPVLSFHRSDGKPEAILFGHSTHTIGMRTPGKRSPSWYGLSAQALEAETGAVTTFLEGASGSTHLLKIGNLTYPQVWLEAERRITNALRFGVDQAQPLEVARVASIKSEIEVKIRRFDEGFEEKRVMDYCKLKFGASAETVAAVFRTMRKELAPRQGEVKKTWIQAMRIGEVAIVGVPAEFFTVLGMEIKKRSPFKHTIIAELANDYVGYVGNRDAYKLGGYQLWTGHHSWTEPGTGERFVNEVLRQLRKLKESDHGR